MTSTRSSVWMNGSSMDEKIMPKVIDIKILSYRDTQRYVVRRAVIAACEEIRVTHPDLEISIKDVKEQSEMEKYTAVMILPSLVMNDKLVCVGRFPQKSEVTTWLQEVTSYKKWGMGV